MATITRLNARRQEDEQARGEAQAGRQDASKGPRRKELEKAAYLTWKPKEYYRGGTRFPKRWFPRVPETQAEVLERKEEMYLRGEHDCSLHCDYPNECGHTIHEAKERKAAEAGPTPSSDSLSPVGTDDQSFEIFSDPVSPPDSNDA